MGRRRRNDNSGIELIARLVVVVFVLSLISPEVRQGIASVGFIALCLIGVVRSFQGAMASCPSQQQAWSEVDDEAGGGNL